MNLDSITFYTKSHNNFKEKVNLRFTLKIPEIIPTSRRIVKTASKLQTLSELENLKTKVNLEQFFKELDL